MCYRGSVYSYISLEWQQYLHNTVRKTVEFGVELQKRSRERRRGAREVRLALNYYDLCVLVKPAEFASLIIYEGLTNKT